MARTKRQFSTDYHDYVFRDGRLVGDFDNMYRHSARVPWDQDTRCERWYAKVGRLMLAEYAPYRSILEMGCGLGFFTARLRGLIGAGRVDAFDISPEAIKRARKEHAGISFYVDDLASRRFRPRRAYSLVVVRDVFWYVFNRMPTVLRNIDRGIAPGGFLYVCQSFPALDRPFVGKEIIPGPDALLAHLGGYAPLYTALLRNHDLEGDGPILHFLGRKPKGES